MALKEGYANMTYPPVYKDVDGIKCPEIWAFNSYDLMSYDCAYCGRGKHYIACRYLDEFQACHGWGDRLVGPMSCKGYVQWQKDLTPIKLPCKTCHKDILDSYMIKKGEEFECFDCDDPNWAKDLPTIESRGAI